MALLAYPQGCQAHFNLKAKYLHMPITGQDLIVNRAKLSETQTVQSNFPENVNKIFIKTSTGYYGGYGATIKDVKLIKSVAGNLKIKASGGILNYKDCMEMIKAGATRIGTSRALFIHKEMQENEF